MTPLRHNGKVEKFNEKMTFFRFLGDFLVLNEGHLKEIFKQIFNEKIRPDFLIFHLESTDFKIAISGDGHVHCAPNSGFTSVTL